MKRGLLICFFETMRERKPKLSFLSTNHSIEVLKEPFEDWDLGTICIVNKLINSDEHVFDYEIICMQSIQFSQY